MRPTTIVAINARRLGRGKSMIGLVDLQLASGLIVRSCTVHRRGSHGWISLPGQRYRDSWEPAIEFVDKETAQQFLELAMEAVTATEAFPELVAEQAHG